LLLLLAVSARAQETAYERQKWAFLDEAKPRSGESAGYRLQGDQTELDLGFDPGADRATLIARRELGDSLTASYESSVGMQASGDSDFAPEDGGGAAGLPAVERTDLWALDWTATSWLSTRVYNASSSAPSERNPFQFSNQTFGVKTQGQVTRLTAVGVELRREETSAAGSAAAASDIYGTTLSQRLGESPFTLEMTPSYQEDYGAPGSLQAAGPSLGNALKWQPNEASQVTLGSQFGNRSLYADLAAERRQLYYTQYEHVWREDVSLLLRTDYESVRRTSAVAAEEGDQRLTLQAGPRFRLTEDFLAQIDMSYGVKENTVTRQAGTEQAVSVSIRGKF
jgi:hypothetical protein